MDFSLSEEQVLLRDSVEKYVRENCDVERHRTLSKTDPGFDPAAWQQFAELGWLAVPFSEELGGIGGGAVDLAVVTEALGKGLVREPFLHTAVTCGALLREGGSGEQQQAFIPGIIEGSAQWAFAFAEVGSGYDMSRIATSASSQGDGYVLQGCKQAVLNAHCANYLLLTAQVDGGDEITLFIVDADAEGVSLEPFVAVDGSRGAHVTLDGATVPADRVVGAVGGGTAALEAAINYAIVAIGGEALGAMQALLQATVEYAKTREQFGQPIGKFQVLQHRMADMYMKVEETRSLLLNAAIQIDEGNAEISAACAALKVKVAEAGRFVAKEAVQVHGGIGMTDELVVGHHYKRLMLLGRLYGDEGWYLQRFADLAPSKVA